MLLKTPDFWGNMHDVRGTLLTPLSWLYRAGCLINQSLHTPYLSSLPVICVGNVVTGGSGKTPSVIALLALIRQHNLYSSPCVLTRGYGGALKGPTSVDVNIHTADDVGDEALLLAHHAPVIVSRNRADGARLAELSGHDVILMDDGLQNNTLVKTLSFLVIDGAYGFGNNRVLPAGPLREPADTALARTDVVIWIGEGNRHIISTDKPVFKAVIKPEADIDTNTSYIAFAGLGRPEKFFNTLKVSGANVLETYAFADHHPYTEDDLKKLSTMAAQAGARLITTEKDYVRIPDLFRQEVDVFPVELVFETPDDVIKMIRA